MTPRPGRVRAVLAHADLRRFVLARLFSSFARSTLHATVAWHVWTATGSYFQLGAIHFVEFLPVIPLSLYAGALADEADRRRIVLTTQGVALLCTAGLAVGTGAVPSEIALLFAAAFVLAGASAFENPAGAAILPSLVPRELLATAIVLQANARNLASVAGPAATGIVVSSSGIPAAYAVATAGFAVSILLLLGVEVPRVAGATGRVSLASVLEGIRFVRREPVILGAMSLDMFAVIFAGATALLPVFADEILGVGARGYGILAASMQVGTLATAALLLALPPVERAGRALMLAVLAFGAATVIFGLSRSFALSVAALVACGMADQISQVARSVLLQLSTPDALRGRMNSVNMIFIGASNELGGAESGFLAALTSATISVVGGGFACLAALAVVARSVPSLRSYSTRAAGVPSD